MLGLLPEIGREKREWDRLKGPDPHPNLPQVMLIPSCQQAKYDRTIALKAAAESIQTDRVGHYRAASEMPFEWHQMAFPWWANCGPLWHANWETDRKTDKIRTALSIGCNLVRHITIDSISTRSWNDSKALIRIFSICLTSESVADLLIQPKTMMALGWRAGLYWNANLKIANTIIVTVAELIWWPAAREADYTGMQTWK